jgi:CheY-like chemotaxis protein
MESAAPPVPDGVRSGSGSIVVPQRPSLLESLSSSTEASSHRDVRSILIAEDHQDSQEALAALLDAFGYEIHLARDGRQAVAKAVEVRPDLILMDIMMPEMDGLTATRTLRSTPGFGDVPIIALTAMEGARQVALEAGCSDVVPKPIEIASFLHRVRAWIDGTLPPAGNGMARMQ